MDALVLELPWVASMGASNQTLFPGTLVSFVSSFPKAYILYIYELSVE